MDVEAAFSIVGNFGRYQLLLSLFAFLGNFVFSLQMVLMVIVGDQNVTIPNERNMTTIVTDFDLYHKKNIVDLMQSLLMGGYMIGCFVFGQLSDSFGRRYCIIVASFFTGVIGFCSALTTSWITFAVTRFLTGIFLGGAGIVVFVILTEFIGKKSWGFIGLVYQAFFSFGLCFYALLGYLLPNWRHLTMVAASLIFPLFLCYAILIPESPRWLYSTGKTAKAEEVLRMMARRNGRDDSAIRLTAPSREPSTNTFIDLFRHTKLTIWVLTSCFLWFANGLIYYALTLSASSFTQDLYVGLALDGAIEVPGNIICMFIMDWKRLGRKGTLFILFGLCAVCNIILIFVYEIHAAKLTLLLGSKLAIAGSFNVIYVYTGETFPTTLRAVTIGIASISARIGAIIAPFMSVKSLTGITPYVLYGVVALASFTLLVLLPRTLGRPVPQTIEEAVHGKTYTVLVNEDGTDADEVGTGDLETEENTVKPTQDATSVED